MSSKGRTAAEVTDKREIARIAKACKSNGGPWSFENVEAKGGFNLRCVRGMTAWRVNQNWLELTGKAPKVAAKPKAKPAKAPKAKATAKPQAKPQPQKQAPAPAKVAEKTPTAPQKKPFEQSVFDRIQAEKSKGILAIEETPDKDPAQHLSLAEAKRRGDRPKAGYEDAEEDDPEIDEDEVPDEEPADDEDEEEEEPTDEDLDEEEENEDLDDDEEDEDLRGELGRLGFKR
jgi:hypothetical protein